MGCRVFLNKVISNLFGKFLSFFNRQARSTGIFQGILEYRFNLQVSSIFIGGSISGAHNVVHIDVLNEALHGVDPLFSLLDAHSFTNSLGVPGNSGN